MGEDVDALALLVLGMRPDDAKPMLADPAVILHVLVADLRGAGVGSGKARIPRQVAHRLLHLVERPAEIDGGRARGGERLAGAVERLVGLIVAKSEADAVGSGRTDQRRAAHLHGRDRPRRVVERLERHRLEPERQLGLVDDLDRPAVRIEPDGAVMLAVDVHGSRLNRPQRPSACGTRSQAWRGGRSRQGPAGR